MRRTRKDKKIPLEKVEALAVKGKDVNRYFSNGQMMPPLKEIQRVNVDFTAQMLHRLDQLAADLNISRQAVIKSLLMFALNQQTSQQNKMAQKR